MRALKSLLFVATLAFVPLSGVAQNIVFTNNDGTFTATSNQLGATLSLTGSELTAITGAASLGVPDNSDTFPCGACLGTLTLTTGPLSSGHILAGGAFTPNSGTFHATYTGGVTFTGTFATSSWENLGGNTWQFHGSIMGGMLTVGSNTYMIPNAVTVQLTTVGSAPGRPGGTVITFKDSQGTTNFPSPAPEPGTLTLFGSGLIVVGMIARRRLSGKVSNL
jgi:hypothetical protein